MAKGKQSAGDLETVDLDGVEILAIGGPVHGRGSPPEGDYWTTDDLRAMAEAHAELHGGGELNPTVAVNPPKNKIGHMEQPAVGYLENIRVDKTGTRLLADVKRVPKKLGQLIRAGAYRARSTELSKVTSQTTGKSYDWVVTGLAWLGAKLPAVRTLRDPDDVIALYEGDGEVEVRLVVEYETGAVVWDPSESLQGLRDRVNRAVNGDTDHPQYWVRDIAAGKALLERCGAGETEAFVAAFTMREDGEVEIAPSSDWTAAEEAWLERSRELSGIFDRPADTRPTMPDLVLNDDTQRKLADALKLEGDITAESLVEAATKAPEVTPETTPEPNKELDEVRSLAQETQERLKKTEEKLAHADRDTVIERALSDGRIEPGQRETVEKLYDSNPEACRAYIASLPKNDKLAREYGSDEEGEELTEEQRQLADQRERRQIAQSLGIREEEVI